MSPTPIRPMLVVMSWRGGARFERCLASIAPALHHFQRVVLSVTSNPDSPDVQAANKFAQQHADSAEGVPIDVLCTGRELPTMEHQAFWIAHLQRTGATPDDWICWLAYDDEIRVRGIDAIVDTDGSWPLRQDTVYFGPWAMRHEQADTLWDGDPTQALESWTSFPLDGPTTLTVAEWISGQLRQPTYMQMSGSVCPLRNFIELRDSTPAKRGPMRIEMAVAAGARTANVAEFAEPIVRIYGRSNSDRANYGKAARREDLHLAAWLARYARHHPDAIAPLASGVAQTAFDAALSAAKRNPKHSEAWVVRSHVEP